MERNILKFKIVIQNTLELIYSIMVDLFIVSMALIRLQLVIFFLDVIMDFRTVYRQNKALIVQLKLSLNIIT